MPQIIFTFFLLAVSFYGQLSHAGLRDRILETPEARNASLFALFSDFCLRGSLVPLPTTQISCVKTSTATIQAMDLDSQAVARPDGQKEVFSIVFHRELLKLAQDPASIQVLQQLDFDLTYRLQEFQLNQSVNMVLKNNLKTLRWIAVMLQDTSPKLAHIHYLKTKLKGSMIAQKIAADLEVFIGKIINYQTANVAEFSQNQLLPRSTRNYNRDLGWRLYHFYVPAYLANRMIANGESHARAAYGAALMNISYEAITVDGDLKYPTGLTKFKPEREKAFDIYAGYVGACYGIGKPTCIQQPNEFKAIIVDDALETISYFRQLLKTI